MKLLEDLINFINTCDNLSSLFVLVVVMLIIGNGFIDGDPARRRIAKNASYATFVVYLVVQLFVLGAGPPGIVLVRFMRAGIAAALAFGAVAAVSPILFVVHDAIQSAWVEIDLGRWQRAREQAEYDRQKAEEERERQRDARKRELEWSRSEQERQAKRRVRDRVVYEIELLHTSLAEHLPPSMSRQHLSYFVKTYMSDSESIDVIRERGQQLAETLQQLAGRFGGVTRFNGLQELISHFEEQREAIRQLQLDPDDLDTLLTEINIEQDRAIREFRL